MDIAVQDRGDRAVDMGKTLRVLRRRKRAFMAPIIGAVLIGWVAAANDAPTYTATSMLVLDARKVQVVDIGSVVSQLPPDSSALRSELDVISSRSVAERVARRIDGATPGEAPRRHWWSRVFSAPLGDGKIVDELVAHLRVSNDARSYTIHVAFTSADPKYSAEVANLFAEEYLSQQVQTKTNAAREATHWLGVRTDQLRSALEQSELAIERYRAENGISGSKEVRPEEAQLAAMEEHLNEARAHRLAATASLASLRKATNNGDPGATTGAIGSELLTNLREQEANARRQVEEMKGLGTERHPDWARLNKDLATIRTQIAEETARLVARQADEVRSAAAQEANLEEAVSRLRQQQSKEGGATVRLWQLTREAEANRVIYETFLNRYKQTIEQIDIQEADSKLISRAQPPALPDHSRFIPILAIAIFGGTLAGALLVWAREHFDNSLRGPDDTESVTGETVVGVVPDLPDPDLGPDAPLFRPASRAVIESLRLIQLTLCRGPRSTGDDHPRVLMITSALRDEGKTAFCLSLAQMLAGDGRRVLIVDADLRGARIGRDFGVAALDLAELFHGRARLSDVAKAIPECGADYVGAKDACANPQAVLAAESFAGFIRDCAQRYDTVIVHTPPVMAAADAAIVATLADATLLLVRQGHTDGCAVLAALRCLRLCQVRIDGIVLTQMAAPPLTALVPRFHGMPKRLLRAARQIAEAPTARL